NDARRRSERLATDRLEHRELARALEQTPARQELVKHDSQCENVAPAVDRTAAALLGRHVLELAFELANLGVGGPIGGFCDAEIEDFDAAVVGDEDVLRRNVAVNEVERAAMGVAQFVSRVKA